MAQGKRHRRYSEGQMGMILDRAASMQSVALTVPAAEGHTLEEIKSIAQEAGLAVSSIESAAQSLDAETVPSHGIMGRPARMQLATRVEGELPAAEREELIAFLQRLTGRRGTAKAALSTVEWTKQGLLGSEAVAVTSRKGTTRVLVTGSYSRGWTLSALVGGWLAMVPTLALLLGLLRMEEGAIPFVMAAFFLGARTGWGWFSRNKERELHQLSDQVADFVEESLEVPKDLLPLGTGDENNETTES